MIIAITVVIMIIILLLLIFTTFNNNIIITTLINNINNNGNVSKNQVIWLKKCFLRLCLKVFKLSVFFNVLVFDFHDWQPVSIFKFFMRYCRHFVQLKTKANTFVFHNWSFFFSFCVKFGYHAEHASSECGCIMALHNNRRNSGVKNRFFPYKNFCFWFIFLMVFNANDSADIVFSSTQPKYVTWEYCFISNSIIHSIKLSSVF